MCFAGDWDGESLGERKIVKARKQHRCDACVRPIEPGAQHWRSAYLYDGTVSTLRLCVRCHRLGQLIHEHEIAEGCDWNESWCPLGEEESYLRERGLTYDEASDSLMAVAA